MSEAVCQVKVRPTVEGDEETLWLMLYYASHSDDEPGIEPEDIKSNPDLIGYIEGWRRGGRIGMVAEVGSAPVGAAWLRVFGEEERANPLFMGTEVPELAIAVLAGRQGEGIGTALLRALLQRVEGSLAIALSVRRGNPAVRLYERLGFETEGEMTNRVGTVSVKMLRRGVSGGTVA